MILQTIKTYGSRLEAEVAKSFLTSSGIIAVVISDDAGGMYPPSFSAVVELKVASDDAEVALQLLNENEQEPT